MEFRQGWRRIEGPGPASVGFGPLPLGGRSRRLASTLLAALLSLVAAPRLAAQPAQASVDVDLDTVVIRVGVLLDGATFLTSTPQAATLWLARDGELLAELARTDVPITIERVIAGVYDVVYQAAATPGPSHPQNPLAVIVEACGCSPARPSPSTSRASRWRPP